MRIIDFEYKNKLLSQFNLMLCDPDNNGGTNIIEGAKLTFNTVKPVLKEKYKKINTTYESPLSATFGICKRVCNGVVEYFDQYELRDIERWLSSKTYQQFQPCDEEFDDIVFFGSFTQINYERHGEHIYKLVVTFETDSPHGYTKEKLSKFTIRNANDSFHLINSGDEVGYISPSFLEIKIKKAGNLLITNSLDEDSLSIKNCKLNEIITLDNDNQILSTDTSSHKIYDDFNYKFLKLFRTEDTSDNKLTFSLPCEVTVRYRLIRKVPILCQ